MLELIPAIDLLGDEAVRLRRGDYDRVTLRRNDPEELVRELAAAGAGRIHVVDLDGARAGGLRLERIAQLAAAAGPVPVQASGGVRSVADAEALLAAGADRVVVGTAAWRDPEALDELVSALGERLVVAVDVRDGRVPMQAFGLDADLDLEEAADRCAAAGVARLLCTAIDRDGTLAGPDLELVRTAAAGGRRVLAAGGVRTPEDVDALAGAGAEAAVVGRALMRRAL